MKLVCNGTPDLVGPRLRPEQQRDMVSPSSLFEFADFLVDMPTRSKSCRVLSWPVPKVCDVQGQSGLLSTRINQVFQSIFHRELRSC